MTKKSELITFEPATDFTGYPFEAKVQFKAGETSIPVPPCFVSLMRIKGLVAEQKEPS